MLKRIKAWWNLPAWSRWYTVRLRCPRCEFPFADRRTRGDEHQTVCANCALWHDAPQENGNG